LREYSKTILPDNMRADRAAALPLPEFMQRRITPINASIQETYNETQTFLQSCDQASPILGRMIRNQVWPVELGLKWIRLPTTLGGAIDLGAVVSGAGTGVIRNAGTTITNTVKGSLKSMVSALRGAGTNASRLVPTGLGKPLSMQGAGKAEQNKIHEKIIQNDVLSAPRTRSGLKNDHVKSSVTTNEDGKEIIHEFRMAAKAHGFPNIIDNYAGQAVQFDLARGAKLYQLEGVYNGKVGRFEWIIQDSKVTHRMFIENGRINANPIKK
jgi:hypothetical protein